MIPRPLLLAAVALGAGLTAFAQTPQRPNVIVILVDDMGWSDIGCYGSEIPTPNLDRLAKNGLSYTQFYNTARCSPTRASLLTGEYPHQAGMGYLDGLVEPASKGTHGRLENRVVTIPEVLDGAGYFTAMAGKWHLGQNHGTPPWSRGFEHTLNSPAGGVYFPGQKNRRLFVDGKPHDLDDPIFGNNWYSTQLFTDWSLKYAREAQAEKKPFFLYLAYCAPHFPLMAPAETIAKFRGKYRVGWDKLREARYEKQKRLGLIDPAWPMAPRPDDVRAWDSLTPKEQDRFDNMMAIYAAMISEVDRNVGRLIDGLRASGQLDNTVIFFLSDNGGNAESGPGGRTLGGPLGSAHSTVFLGMEWATLSNTPFRRYKHFTHEGGISTPLIVSWPAGLAPDRRGAYVKDPGHVIDLMPTIVELTGATYPTRYHDHDILPEAGRSLVPTFSGQPLVRPEPIYFAHEGNKGLRDGDWKLVEKHLGQWELYNLATDRTEQHDLAAEQPDRVKAMAAKWDAWAAKSFVDPWPGGPRTNWGAPVNPKENANQAGE